MKYSNNNIEIKNLFIKYQKTKKIYINDDILECKQFAYQNNDKLYFYKYLKSKIDLMEYNIKNNKDIKYSINEEDNIYKEITIEDCIKSIKLQEEKRLIENSLMHEEEMYEKKRLIEEKYYKNSTSKFYKMWQGLFNENNINHKIIYNNRIYNGDIYIKNDKEINIKGLDIKSNELHPF